MKADFITHKITLTEEEAQVATAFVPDFELAAELYTQLLDIEERRERVLDKMHDWDHEILRERSPHLYECTVDYSRRNTLIDGMLSASLATSREMLPMIERYGEEQVRSIGRSDCVALVTETDMALAAA